ncbi:glycosyltransferase family 8 protein [Elizabethkingia meningoseptica]|uniref:glycosyltransferase family 8 protein n=1 Tax=Elizabethkingia meningoseptica TaxID=238 RepID=UPI0020118124|nr:glycosyltransferase family 8 protein [Elizabethkingia meningoseptica]MCL1675692.1 glycosyltransferase family 8 protein [Elizabethkingia meningoseptica]MCL1686892.1 glycosyltransferase family 8 protein [Elizabethkingia meningoseptica]
MEKLSTEVNEVPIVIAFTPNYFIPAATCLYSILKHSPEAEKFHVICLLTEELPQRMKENLKKLDENRIRFSFMNLTGKLQDIYIDERYTVAASYRLLLPEILPEYDKVLYIDCDVIVRNDLAKLYHEVDLGDNYMAAVYEASLDFQTPYLISIGCEPGKYINSGFLVMNLAQLRQDNMVPRFLEAAKAEGLQFPDQDVLNQLCKDRILGLPPYYNSIRTFFLPQYKKDFLHYYSEEDWAQIQQHGTIHYTGDKPWNSFTIEFGAWWQYYDLLPEDIKSENKVKKKLYYLAKVLNTKAGNFILLKMLSVYRSMK